MYIDQLRLENVRTFGGRRSQPLIFTHPDCDYRSAGWIGPGVDERLPRPRLPNVTLLLGDNGSGKSTILRAIAASAFGPAASDLLRDPDLVRRGEEVAKIHASFRLHEQDRAQVERVSTSIRVDRVGERITVTTSSSTNVPVTGGRAASLGDAGTSAAFGIDPLWRPVYESKNDAFFIVGYGATRRVEPLTSYDPGARVRARASRDLRVQSLFEDSFSLIPLAGWLPQLRKANPGRYTQVIHLMNALLKPSRHVFSGEQAKNGDYLYRRGDSSIPFQSLSDGYRAFIGWVADLLHHVCFGCPSGRKLVQSQGIVLVDEIDLHLHPRWQMQVAKTVARTLPNMQFVFTSHSPLVAGSLEWMNILTLKLSAKTNRTTASRLKQSIHGLDADQILLTDFFGLKSTLADDKQRRLNEITNQIRAGDRSAPLLLIREMSQGMEAED